MDKYIFNYYKTTLIKNFYPFLVQCPWPVDILIFFIYIFGSWNLYQLSFYHMLQVIWKYFCFFWLWPPYFIGYFTHN